MYSTETIQMRSRPNSLITTLPILVVYAHSSCNCRCIMCDIWKTRDNKIFGVRELQAQLESIRNLGVQWVVFSGGEPLMNPELPQVSSILRAEGIRLTLLSTGLLLKKYAESVVRDFDEVIVSLDGPPGIHDKIRCIPGAYALLKSGVKAVKKLRPSMRLTARSTIQKANHRFLVETACTAHALGLDGISFLAVDVSSTAFNRLPILDNSRTAELGLTVSEVAELEQGVEALIRDSAAKFGPDFIAESPAKLRRIVGQFRATLGLQKPQAPICNAPWVSAVLEADGTVRPCFFHDPIGKLRDGTTLQSVATGSAAQQFREQLEVDENAICKNCVCSLNYSG